jgi:hypothetical protein
VVVRFSRGGLLGMARAVLTGLVRR